MSHNNELQEVLNRMEKITVELTRIKNAIGAIQEGVAVEEAFDDEIYLESRQEKKKCRNYVSRIIEHLLKIAYCDNDRNIDHWKKEVENFRDKVISLTDWCNKHKDTNLINYIISDMDDIYDTGIKFYKDDAKEHDDLLSGIKRIPTECPWEFKDLLEECIAALIHILYETEDDVYVRYSK